MKRLLVILTILLSSIAHGHGLRVLDDNDNIVSNKVQREGDNYLGLVEFPNGQFVYATFESPTDFEFALTGLLPNTQILFTNASCSGNPVFETKLNSVFSVILATTGFADFILPAARTNDGRIWGEVPGLMVAPLNQPLYGFVGSVSQKCRFIQFGADYYFDTVEITAPNITLPLRLEQK